MISLDISPNARPLDPVKVRRRAGFTLLAFPIGFALFTLGAAVSRPLLIGGAFLMVAAFVSAMLVIPSSIQRIAGGAENGLDEFQLTHRLRAQAEAYRWFSGFAVLLVCYANFGAIFGLAIDTRDPAFSAVVFWVIAYSTVMPAWFMARGLPRHLADGED